MKKRVCIFVTVLFLVVSFPTKYNVECSNRDFLENSLFNHLIITNQFNEIDEYEIKRPISIIECSTRNDERINCEKSEGRIYPINRNCELSYLAYLYDDTIKIIDVEDDGLKTAIEAVYDNAIVVNLDGSLYLCDDEDVIYTSENSVHKTALVRQFISTSDMNDFYINENELGNVHFNISSRLSSYNMNLPIKGQNPYNYGCWAACIASFDSYYNNRNTTTTDVVYDTTHSYNQCNQMSVSFVCSSLQLYYDIMASHRNINSDFCSNVRTDISLNKAYMLFWKQEYYDHVTSAQAVAYHFTVLDGYAINGNTYTYSIMDPYVNSNMTGGRYTLSIQSGSTFPTNQYLYNPFQSGTITGSLSNSIRFNYLIEGAK